MLAVGRPYPAQLLSQQWSLRFNCDLWSQTRVASLQSGNFFASRELSSHPGVRASGEASLHSALPAPERGPGLNTRPTSSPSHGVSLRLCGRGTSASVLWDLFGPVMSPKRSQIFLRETEPGAAGGILFLTSLSPPVFLCVGFHSFTYLGSSAETTRFKCSIYPLTVSCGLRWRWSARPS